MTDADLALPAPEEAAEDAFVVDTEARGDLGLIQARVGAALDARRPRLAARLANLISDAALEALDDPALRRARAAARLLLVAAAAPQGGDWAEFEEAWALARRQHVQRATDRMRRQATTQADPLGFGGGARRGPRRR